MTKGKRPMGKLLLAVVLALTVSAGNGLLGQSSKKQEEAGTRSVTGTVSNAAGTAVAGAVVQLKNLKTDQIRSFITKEDGSYAFHGLSTDIDYQLKADYQGASSGNRTLSVFDGRKTAVINLKLNK